MTVSSATEMALRDAMERLLAGRASHTDGRLTKENLYREAGVSRATMNRAQTILTAWNLAVTAPTATSPTKDIGGELERLQIRLGRKTRESAELQSSNVVPIA